MRIKKLVVALAACLVFTAVASSAAQATLAWTVGEENKVLSSETVDAFTNPGDIPWEFSTHISGMVVTLVDEGVTCAGEGECTIFGEGKSKLKLTFTKVTVAEPKGCEVRGGTFTTRPLKGQVFMSLAPTSVYDKIEPAEGTVFFTVELVGCAVEGKYPFKGRLVGEATNPTGAVTPDWMLNFKPEIQELVDPEGGLKVGTEVVKSKGYTHNELIGVNKGAKFGVME